MLERSYSQADVGLKNDIGIGRLGSNGCVNIRATGIKYS